MNGQRAPDGFSGRALPHFPRGTRTPEGKGFVAASFYRCALKVAMAGLHWIWISLLLLLLLLLLCACCNQALDSPLHAAHRQQVDSAAEPLGAQLSGPRLHCTACFQRAGMQNRMSGIWRAAG